MLLQTAWDADPVASLVNMHFENLPQKDPSRSPDTPWARATILFGEGKQIAMGGTTSLHRREGILVVSLFVPLNYSMATLDALSELVVSTFEGATGSNGTVFITGSTITNVGIDGLWFQQNVAIDFEFDKVV